MLREVADLVRQASEPAADRILEPLARRDPGSAPRAHDVEPEPDDEPDDEPEDEPERAERLASRAGDEGPELPPGAGAMLEEVAELVRQAAEPAAERIVARLDRRGEPLGTEPVSDLASEPSPETEARLQRIAQQYSDPMGWPSEPEPPGTWFGGGVPANRRPTGRRATNAPATVMADRVDAVGVEDMAGLDAAVAARTVIGAAIDIGATSVHLLVAAATGHRLEPLLDESAFLGLGDRASAAGFLGSVARDDLVSVLAGYVAAAREHGATEITVVATEPLRRAADAATLVWELESRTGVPVHVLDPREEGMLTLIGVTAGRPMTRETLIVDIGGGSTEIVVARPGVPVEATGLRVGAAALTAAHVVTDPPSLEEIEAMSVAARAVVSDAPDATPAEIIAVGGTASNLLRLLPPNVVDQVLTSRRIAITLAMLTVEGSAEAATRHALRPARARILPAGAVILDAVLERYGADRARVSADGIREGAILAAAVAGAAWRDRLGSLAQGWRV